MSPHCSRWFSSGCRCPACSDGTACDLNPKGPCTDPRAPWRCLATPALPDTRLAAAFRWRAAVFFHGRRRAVGDGHRHCRRLHRQQDRRMPVAIVARWQQHFEAVPGGGGHRPSIPQHRPQRIAPGLDLGQRPAFQRPTHHRRRRLAKRAGFYILREPGHPRAVHHHIHRHGRPAQGRAPPRRPLRGRQPPGVGNVGGQFQDPARVQLDKVAVAHHFPLCPCEDRPLAAPCKGSIPCPSTRNR